MKGDEQIAWELKRASAGLLFMSEADYPFEVVRWEEAAVTPDLLRRYAGQPPDASVTMESMDDFFRAATTAHEQQSAADRQVTEKYRALVKALNANLLDVCVYRVGERNMPVYVVGRAPSGRWLGLSTRVVET